MTKAKTNIVSKKHLHNKYIIQIIYNNCHQLFYMNIKFLTDHKFVSSTKEISLNIYSFTNFLEITQTATILKVESLIQTKRE